MNTTIWKGLSLVCALILIALPVNTTAAQSPSLQFTTNITYQNVGGAVAHPIILYYPYSSNNPLNISRPDLPIGASATISAGLIAAADPDTQGSAVVKSDIPLAVLMTQVSNSSAFKPIAIASGSSSASAELWFVNIQKGTAPSKLALQNIDTVNNNLKLKFFSSSAPVELNYKNVKPGRSVLIDVAQVADLTADGYPAIQVLATRSSDSAPGKVIGTHWISSETDNTSIEGIQDIGKKIFMPLAFCQITAGMTTSYYVFNTDQTNSTNVKVSYSNGKSESKNLPAASGAWFNACTPSHTSVGFNGSGIVTSTSTKVIATGIIKNGGVKTGFIGQAAGTNQLAVPYAVYSASQYSTKVRQRTTIQIMNLGSAIAKNTLKVKYFDKNGKLVGVHTLAGVSTGARANSSPASIGSAGSEFGYYSDGSCGGSALIVAPKGSQIMATVWVSSMTGQSTYTGELYNAISIVSE